MTDGPGEHYWFADGDESDFEWYTTCNFVSLLDAVGCAHVSFVDYRDPVGSSAVT